MSLDITNNFRIICKVNHKHEYKTLIIRHKYNYRYYKNNVRVHRFPKGTSTI